VQLLNGLKVLPRPTEMGEICEKRKLSVSWVVVYVEVYGTKGVTTHNHIAVGGW
jgi:hypothetical protein